MEAGGVIRYEVDELKRFREETERWRRNVDKDRRDLEFIRADVADLTKAFNSLRRMLLTFALSVAGSAIVFALSILIATRRLP